MKYENSGNIIYQYTADRLKRRREVLKLTNDVIARKKIFVHYEAYTDYATDEDEPEKFNAETSPVKSKFDPSMISRILNNERGKLGERNSPNPYLIPPAYEELLMEQLQFEDTKELYWGASIEVKSIVQSFYTTLFEEILEDNQSELSELLNLYIADYVPYSRNLANYRLIAEKCIEQCSDLSEQFSLIGTKISKSELWDMFTHMLENDFEYLLESFERGNPLAIAMYTTIDFLMEMIGENTENRDQRTIFIAFQLLKFNLDSFRRESIGRIIFINFENLIQLYQDYFFQLSNFKFLNKKISEFVSDILTPFFKELLGKTDEFKSYSLGYRVRTIIETDIESIYSYESRVTQEQYDDVTNQNSSIYKRLLETTITYISDLKYMQWLTDRESADVPLNEDVERFYLQATDFERLHTEWLNCYNVYLANSYLAEYGDYLEEDEYDELVAENDKN
ncbi:hypothetical protein [Streptococcus thoraltensis]|uniref:hypothetical protein n=1 Tax=Streptococcus thoraltensis TaxID=55085 RepID=UPI002A7ED52C|nr:hypothetical protein [Streptococcus thoraltensis]MDY4761177.1 hypothetical protein [Streptococcus thoraltensis]